MFSVLFVVPLHAVMHPTNPKIAIIDPNTLAAMGLRQLLQSMMPFMEVDICGSLAELTGRGLVGYMHFFVAVNVFLENKAFFGEHSRQTIILTRSDSHHGTIPGFHTINVNVAEDELTKQILILQQQGHKGGRNLPDESQHAVQKRTLSEREAEVMVLIVKGFINKEIADRLNISLATVITHRKNIMTKLGLRSVSALTIYAVMHGYIDIDQI